MKKYIFILLSVLLYACKPFSQEIILNFESSNANASSVIVGYGKTMDVVELDENGRGTWIHKGYDAVYATLVYGMEMKRVYAEKGDESTVVFDGRDFSGSFVLEGRMAPAADYINSVTLTSLPVEDYALPFDEYMEKLAQKEKDAMTLLAAHDLKDCGNFVEAEKGRIKYSYACSMLMYPVGHQMVTRNSDYKPSEEYYSEIAEYFVENPAYLPADNYKEFIAEAAHLLDEANRDVRLRYPKLLAEMRYIAAQFNDAKIKEAIIHYICLPYIEQLGTENTEEMLNIYRTYVKNPDLLAAFQEKYDKWDKAMPGKPSPDFEAEDIDSKKYSLADFRGKYVYIDVWATWCGPCQREIPYLKQLEAQFEGKDIVFVGLSVDKDKAAWEAKVRSGALSGVQLYLGQGSEFQKEYKINGIPRFILLDKEGKIVNSNMTRPSQEQTAATISAL